MSLKFHIQNIPFEIEHEFFFRWNKLFKRRPSSAPFLSGDTYRAFCDVLYDDTALCTADDIFEKAKVFVSSRLLEDFVQNVLSQVKHPFILITHQGDSNITSSDFHRSIADDTRIIHWFAQNCTFKHKKVTPLPIGLEDLWRHNAGSLYEFKKQLKLFRKGKNSGENKKPEILLGFSLGTNPDSRFKCYRALWHKPFTRELYNFPSPPLYRKKLMQAMFVASPTGNGLDCHRTWEAMYLQTIPIVEDNYMNRFFASLGLPLLCIKDWKDCENWTEDFLRKTYYHIIQSADTAALYSIWWEDKIQQL